MKKVISVLLVLLMVSSVFAGGAGERNAVESYPRKTVNFVVPAAAGATMDILVRGLDESLDLGQPLAISNMAGASQTLGIAEVASRPADGYTLTCSGAAGTLIQPLLLDLTYDFDDFRYISLLNDAIPNAIGVSVSSPYYSWDDIQAVLDAGETVHFTSPNTGSVGHLAALNLISQIGSGEHASYVSYNGSAEADTAVMSGDVDFIVNDVDLIMDRVDNGQYRCIMVLADERSELAPDVPCALELGINGMSNFMGMTWIMVNADTPDEIVSYIKAKLDEAIGSETFTEFLATMNKQPTRVLPEEEITEILRNAQEAYKSVIDSL